MLLCTFPHMTYGRTSLCYMMSRVPALLSRDAGCRTGAEMQPAELPRCQHRPVMVFSKGVVR